ncbi:family 43 glycosylhydrolase [Microbacterium sp. W1N]|uniref:family 43 glycosylhydrolase n=1 Tax=Microbacterium festucae TaxID=2977531 RepID=UPI0021BDF4BD|nr:family 43 glycosylhydrolase [Microbacterium festucae]MCT9821356.1 family 43 glycosylhydrolase [Microbacterium festucae]
MAEVSPQYADTRVFCNPLDLAYRYQDVRFTGVVQGVTIGEPRRSVHREAADPSVVRYRGRYFLFASMSAGFWHSSDLVAWSFAPTVKLPAFDYAPDVREIDGALYICASRKTDSPFFRSEDPLSDDFAEVSRGSFPFWDPNLFQDDDGSVYLYWGCDAQTPIQGVPVDPRTMLPTAEPVSLISSDRFARGWEAVGENHRKDEPRTERERLAAQFKSDDPYIEGAWMTKVGGTYYLQYAAPATESNTYADGYVTGAGPLGPFEYSSSSPFSSKPGGFITGAGHGSTFQDEYGNWWHAATMRISVNDVFERRVGLFPAGFDDDGVLFCNQNFGDYPVVVPQGPADPWAPPPWMLLSHGARVHATSAAPGHPAELAVNEDVRTWWIAGSDAPGESLEVDLGRPMTVAAIQVNLADDALAERVEPAEGGVDFGHSWRAMYTEAHQTQLSMEISLDGTRWEGVFETTDDRPHALAVLPAPREARFVRLAAGRLPFGAPLAVSGLRVFGRADGSLPEAPEVKAVRTGDLTATICWAEADGARGYNVRYGLRPDKLYQSWLVHGATELDLRALNAGVGYWVAVDAFNEVGVTEGEPRPIA